MNPGNPPPYLARRSRRRAWPFVAGAVVLALFALGAWWAWGSKAPAAEEQSGAANGSFKNIAWPSFGQAAVGMVGTSTVETHGSQVSVPTASTAKLITALVVLQKKPLSAGERGPELTMTRDDIALLVSYDKLGGSEIGKVFVGEKLTEYQMLESMMLPSANNMADSLAIWAYGSLPAYREAANAYLANQGLAGTHVGKDASGLDPSTVTTAHDMVEIGKLVMQNPVLAEIVAKKSVSDFPLVGTIKNTNTLLGLSNIVGIKTGNSDEQGGAFVGAARINVNGKPVTVVTAVLGAPSLDQALTSSLTLMNSAEVSLDPSAANETDTVKTVAPSGSVQSGTDAQGSTRKLPPRMPSAPSLSH